MAALENLFAGLRTGGPHFVCAPMVAQSELAFRRLVRRHGVQLCFTPMLNAGCFVRSSEYRRKMFDGGIHPDDRPLVAQIAGRCPDTMAEAAHILAGTGTVDGIDINLGCPQRCARRGQYGAFLLDPEERPLLLRIVRAASDALAPTDVKLSCKIRLLAHLSDSVSLALQLQAAGARMLTVHGRTAQNKNVHTGAADWDAIRAIEEALRGASASAPAGSGERSIALIANGGVASRACAMACLKHTGADGVMSSEALLEQPHLFAIPSLWETQPQPSLSATVQLDMAHQYLELASEEGCGPPHIGYVKAHLFKMLHAPLTRAWQLGLAPVPDLRPALGGCGTIDEVHSVLGALRADVQDVVRDNPPSDRLEATQGWYMRRRSQPVA